MIGILGIVVLLLLIMLRVPIAFTFFAVGFVGTWIVKGINPAINVLGTSPFQTLQQTGWTVIPLFVCMGALTQYTGIASEFFEGVKRWIGHFRGGLLYSIIMANTAFGACCGAIIAAVVTFSSISLPETRKAKYSDTITLGCIVTSGVLSALVPPSLLFVIYAMLTQNSVLDLFMAGIIPGFLLAVLYGITTFILTRINPSLAPATPKTSWAERIKGLPLLLSISFLFVFMIGGMYVGMFTPTEAGGMGALIVLLIAAIKRKLSWSAIKQSSLETVSVVVMIGMLIIGANIFNVFLAITGVPQAIASFLTSISTSPWSIMIIVLTVYIIIGFFLDVTAAVILTLPMFYPALVSAGWNPIHIGVLIVFTIIIGGITPPFGMTVFALSGTTKIPAAQIFRGALPYLGALFACIILILIFPELSLWIPSSMK
jgi:tripartite ATP-independent transporter DctM subunit